MVAMEQGYNREAEKYFQQGLKITPNHALILTSLGHLYIRMNRLRLAISTLLKATQYEPALPDGWYELGRAYMETREWQQALNAFDHALQLNHDAVNTYSAMASCYLKMNKRSEARQKADQALQLDPSNAEALRVKKQL
jgi:tetratricopeptide (TPR) repeat protein